MKRITLILILTFGATIAHADEYGIFDTYRSVDPLAQRDEWGLVHQNPRVNDTDYAPRYHWRFCYYFKSGQQLTTQPAYVGSLQTALRRLGYYCGPIDGIFSAEVEDAIAHLQKNSSMHVTGTLTTPVRRALHLP
ncbi:MAG: peptidoglycan-binding domain-containing protein [Chthoniobacterales bacterium]